jgi:hypothetical protein
VIQDRDDLVVGQFGVEQRRALEFGEAGLAGVAVEQAVLPLGEAVADREVAGTPLTVPGAVGILVAEVDEVVDRCESSVAVHRSGHCKTRGPGSSDSRKMGVLRMSKVEKPLVFKDSRV